MSNPIFNHVPPAPPGPPGPPPPPPPPPPPGGSSIFYQWQVSSDGGLTFSNLLDSANSANLTLTNIKSIQDGYLYRAQITSGNATIVSNPAKLIVFPSISITTQPTDQNVENGQVSYSILASGSNGAPVLYQWQSGKYNASSDIDYYDIPGATGATLNLLDLSGANDLEKYRVKINSYHSPSHVKTITSNSAKLIYYSSDIVIVQQPEDYVLTTLENDTIFSVGAVSTGLLSYQWEESYDGINFNQIPFANEPDLDSSLISNIENKDNYKYRVFITSENASIYSDIVDLYAAVDLEDVTSSARSQAPIPPVRAWGDPHYIFASKRGTINTLDDNGRNSNQPIVYFYVKYPNGNSFKLISQSTFESPNATNGPAALVDFWLAINNKRVYGINDTVSQSTQTPSTSLLLDNPCTVAGLTGWDYILGRCLSFSTQFTLNSSQDANYSRLISNSVKWLSKNKNNPKIIIITSGNPNVDLALKNILSSTLTPETNILIINDTTSTMGGSILENSDIIILQNNYNDNFFISNSNQNSIKQFVAKGGGLLTFEWVVKSAAQGRLKILSDVLPVIPTVITSNKSPSRFIKNINNSILNQNLNDSFVFLSDNVNGIETTISQAKEGATIFYHSEQCIESSGTQIIRAGNILTVSIARMNSGLWNNRIPLDMTTTWSNSIRYNGKIKIGGIFYWALKSLIESQKNNPNIAFRNAWQNQARNGLRADGFSIILRPYGLNRDDFSSAVYENDDSYFINRITEEIGVQDTFWKNLTKLLQGLVPDDKYYKKPKYYFVKHPGNRVAGPGGTVSIDGLAIASDAEILDPKYRWKVSSDNGNTFTVIKDGLYYSGTQTNVLTIKNIESYFNNRIYILEAYSSNRRFSSLTKNSRPAKLNIVNTIAINSFPTAQKSINGTATFSVAATSTDGPLLYQWQISSGVNIRNNIFRNIENAKEAILELKNINSYTLHNSLYRVIISNNNSVVTTNPVLLSVISDMNIVSNPADVSTTTTARFEVVASVTDALSNSLTGPIMYQWEQSLNEGGTWSRASGLGARIQNNYLEFTSVNKNLNNRLFRAVLVYGSGKNKITRVSSPARLTILPSIQTGLISRDITYNIARTAATINLSISATSLAGALQYQWQLSKDGGSSYTSIPSSNSRSIIVNNIPANIANQYKFRVIIANNLDSITVN